MKFEINLYAVLVFLVPGIIILFFAVICLIEANTIDRIIEYGSTNKLNTTLLIVPIIFSIGALIDTLRSELIDEFINIFHDQRLPKDYLAILDNDNLEVFNMLNNQTLMYYRLNANMFFASLVIIVGLLFTWEEPRDFMGIYGMCLLSFVLFKASLKSRLVVIYVMHQFVLKNK